MLAPIRYLTPPHPMTSNAESSAFPTLLVNIESFAQTDPGFDFGWVDNERLLLDSIEEVREELSRRYRGVIHDPLFADLQSGGCLESTISNDPQVGWIFRYHDNVQVGAATKHVPCQDLVRVYQLRGEAIDPTEWEMDDH